MILFDAPLIIWVFIGHAEVSVLAILGMVAIVPAILVVLLVKGKVRIGAIGTASITARSEANAEKQNDVSNR